MWRFIGLLLFFQLSFSQNEVAPLVDSLAQASSATKKADLSIAIAENLQQKDWERTLHYLDVAKENAIESGDNAVLAEFYVAAGNIYSNKDALDIALENYLKAYSFFEEKPPAERYKLENNLAVVYARIENKDEALKYFRRVYDFQQKKKDTLVLAQILNNMGNLYMSKNADSAVVYFKQAQQLSEVLKNPNVSLYVYTNLGRVYQKTGQPEEALINFNKAKNVLRNIENPRAQSFLFNELADFYKSENKLDSAIFYAKKVIAINDTIAPFGFEQQEAVGLLYASLVAQQEYKQAAAYFSKYNQIRDSIDLEDKRVNVERVLIEEKYRTQQKIRELEEREDRFRNYTILLALLALLVFFGALLLRYRAKLKNTELKKQLAETKKKELESNIQLKNKELIGKAMVEIHRTEILEEILTDLKEVRLKAAKKETQNAIDYVVKRLKRDTNTNLWDEFEIRFEQVHESFYKNLMQKHPDLSPKDKRLSALLKLNLTSKEIAQITGQTAKSVENARTRLRKKLNITHSETDLSAYLSRFN